MFEYVDAIMYELMIEEYDEGESILLAALMASISSISNDCLL